MTSPDQQISLRKNIPNVILLCSIVLILIVPYVKNVFIPLGLSFFLTIFLDPVAAKLESRGFSRLFSILALILLSTGFSIIFLLRFSSVINSEINHLVNLNDPSPLLYKLQTLPAIANNVSFQQSVLKFHAFFMFLVTKSYQILPNDFSVVLLIIIVPVMTFLLLKDGFYLKKTIIQTLPNRYFEFALYLIHRLKDQLSNWANKQLLIAVIIGSLSIIAFYLLEISNYISIGILVGFAHLIPYFGPFVGAIIAITLTVLTADSLKLVVAVIIALATVKLMYNLLLSPIIKSCSIDLHPLIILLIMLLGSYVWGLLGLLLFVPIATIFVVIFRESIYCMKQYHIL